MTGNQLVLRCYPTSSPCWPAAAVGCVDSVGLGLGSAVHEVEEAAAALLSGPDNHVRLLADQYVSSCLPCPALLAWLAG
jgi:hypothetical protein